MAKYIPGIPALPLLILTGLILVALAGCDRLPGGGVPNQLNPTPEFGDPSSVTASQLWELFQPTANTFASERYKHRWGVITIYDIDAVTTNGVVVKRMPGPPATLEFRYNYTEYTDEIRRGDDVLVLCNVAGVNLVGNILVFKYCRPHPPQDRPATEN